jgi:hypothetical protein
MPLLETTGLTHTMRYYRAHKDEPEYYGKLLQKRKEYYHNNKERERIKSLVRYYRKRVEETPAEDPKHFEYVARLEELMGTG